MLSAGRRVLNLLGSEAKPARSEKEEIGLIFNFHGGEKPQMYPLRYIEDFSPP
jgi:hypothetical protein